MRTQKMIMLILLGLFAIGVLVVALAIWQLGTARGLVAVMAAILVLGVVAQFVVVPWYRRWGATDDELVMAMPGDQLIEGSRGVTRAIRIAAPPEGVWPWLAQLGFGKAGWYSYDWIDNDGQPSASEIIPAYQDVQPGDKILMMPTMGFEVVMVDPDRALVSVLEDGSTSWSLGLYPQQDGSTRLVSRWRNRWGKLTPATAIFAAITDPGTFIMEQKMLREIRNRAEAFTA